MEQHPVPQNVTTFQFRLIGDMTIKQFGYLAGGILLAYICYKLPLPFFFTWPLALISGLGGFGLAFVPVEERPMDVWVLSFFKNVYSPTQYIWQKQKPTPEPTETILVPQKQATLSHAPRVPSPSYPTVIQQPPQGFHVDIHQQIHTTSPPNTQQQPTPSGQTTQLVNQPHSSNFLARLFSFSGKSPPYADRLPKAAHTTVRPSAILSGYTIDPFGFLKKLFGLGQPFHVPVASTPFSNTLSNVSVSGTRPTFSQASPLPTPVVTHPTTAIDANVHRYEDKIATLEKELAAKSISDARIIELQKQLTDVITQKSTMEVALQELQKKLKLQSRPMMPSQTVMPSTPYPLRQPTVRVVTADLAPRVGLPRLTTFPNVVTGIIKDHEGNLLPGVLVTVRDKDDVPLRALKTNKLGQFAASTPLPNNTYFIEVEDPRNRYTFDRAQLTLNGGLVPVLEIIAKSQKQVDREKLTKEIFGNQQ